MRGRAPTRPSAVCIGVFDGVHRGHQKILRSTVRWARRRRLEAVCLTFEPHPVRVLSPRTAPRSLQALNQRVWHIRRFGPDRCLVIRFTRSLSRLSPESFVQNFLVGFLGAKVLCVGPDFRFGKGGAGNVRNLRAWAGRYGYRLVVVLPVRAGGEIVSSTRLRHFIITGDLGRAARFLGRPVSLYGKVVKGKGRGRKMGFPTVNLALGHETLPPSGVYAARARSGERIYPAVLHIGPRPTFGESKIHVEAHLLNIRNSFYGKELEIFIHSKIRPVKSFSSAEGLKARIRRDIARTRSILAKTSLQILSRPV